MVAADVILGRQVKVQNNVSIYSGVICEDYVFLGPSCVFTNVKNPRSEISRREQYKTTRVRRGATVGANATVVCGVEIGRYAFVGAGRSLRIRSPIMPSLRGARTRGRMDEPLGAQAGIRRSRQGRVPGVGTQLSQGQ